ncbi:hypothetical protein GCM10008014_13500 [Paenibacillus silvae]|uniref:Uncharacterized protein n=1 Tax=Paenibacillus silvae TaxID=1325358 RepID=A0ABQ1Z3R4_9BACL|nr:hypothetical protein [Paenibacillus silvae]GGH49202.1 hypothetical protein GCM10008014_13500 [Paenibacillus silvae]
MELRNYGNTGMKVSTLGFGGSEIRDASRADVELLLNKGRFHRNNMMQSERAGSRLQPRIGQAGSERLEWCETKQTVYEQAENPFGNKAKGIFLC